MMSRRPLSSSSTYNIAQPTFKIRRRPPPVPTKEDLIPTPPKTKAVSFSSSRVTYFPHPSYDTDEENTPPPSPPSPSFSLRSRTSTFPVTPFRDSTNRRSLVARAISRRKAVVEVIEETFSSSEKSSSSSSCSDGEAGGSRDIYGESESEKQDYRTFHASASQDPFIDSAPSSPTCSSCCIGLGLLRFDEGEGQSFLPSSYGQHQSNSPPPSSYSGPLGVVPALLRTLTSSWPISPPLEGGSVFTHVRKESQGAKRLQAERNVEQYRLVIAGMLLNRIKKRRMTAGVTRSVNGEIVRRAYARSPLAMEVVSA
ncbi:hypothetical protein FRB95_013679 [Tulasnella sp. JGI-2019a]|nr:hypothetical protein FRB95_013679 [Tulasnella sp. JGI-2019a]